MFEAVLVTKDGVATVTLKGELDGASAGAFQEKVKEAAAQGAKSLVLAMQELEYMASAGIRVLVFAMQKMGANVRIYVIAPQEQVLDTIKMTGLHHSVIIQDSLDLEKIVGV